MKICILAPRFPFPEVGGDVLRINNIAKYLKSKGHHVTLVSFYDSSSNTSEPHDEYYDEIVLVKRNKLASMFNSFLFLLTGRPIQCGFYHSKKFQKVFSSLVPNQKFDLYISHLLRMTPYLEKNKLLDNSIIEMSDALSRTYSLSTVSKLSLKSFVYRFERKLILKYEKRVINEFKKVVLVSNKDIEYFKTVFGKEKCSSLEVYTNGVDIYHGEKKRTRSNVISFLGNLRTLQNQDAVIYFVEEVLPLIKKQIPDVVFEVIGAEPGPNIQKLSDGKNIVVTGFVDSVEEELLSSKVCVAPIRIAAGIQNKVLVSMACKVPVVLTELISKPIEELKDGYNCFISTDSNDLADKCIKLLKDEKLNEMIGNNGFEMVKHNYSWFAKLDGYEEIK